MRRRPKSAIWVAGRSGGSSSGGVDVTAPQYNTFDPEDNATGVSIGATLTATMDETVTLGASGTISLVRTSDDVTIDSWDVALDGGSGAGQVEVLTNTALTMHLTDNLVNEIEYYIIWDAGVVVDGSSNPIAAQASKTVWSFTTDTASVVGQPIGLLLALTKAA